MNLFSVVYDLVNEYSRVLEARGPYDSVKDNKRDEKSMDIPDTQTSSHRLFVISGIPPDSESSTNLATLSVRQAIHILSQLRWVESGPRTQYKNLYSHTPVPSENLRSGADIGSSGHHGASTASSSDGSMQDDRCNISDADSEKPRYRHNWYYPVVSNELMTSANIPTGESSHQPTFTGFSSSLGSGMDQNKAFSQDQSRSGTVSTETSGMFFSRSHSRAFSSLIGLLPPFPFFAVVLDSNLTSDIKIPLPPNVYKSWLSDACGGLLWPILHSTPFMALNTLAEELPGRLPMSEHENAWNSYARANELIADAVMKDITEIAEERVRIGLSEQQAAEVKDMSVIRPQILRGQNHQTPPVTSVTILIMGHQMLLLPGLLRNLIQAHPMLQKDEEVSPSPLSITIVFTFNALPVPTAEFFRCLPVRESLLRGILGADIVFLSSLQQCQQLANAATQVLGAEINPLGGSLLSIGEDRWIEFKVLPIGFSHVHWLKNSQVIRLRSEYFSGLVSKSDEPSSEASSHTTMGGKESALLKELTPRTRVAVPSSNGTLRPKVFDFSSASVEDAPFATGKSARDKSRTLSSIDAELPVLQPAPNEVQAGGKMKIIFALDALDPFGAPSFKLDAIEKLLVKYPSWKGKFKYIHVLRELQYGEGCNSAASEGLRIALGEQAARINGKYSTPVWSPITLLPLSSLQHAEIPDTVRELEFLPSRVNPANPTGGVSALSSSGNAALSTSLSGNISSAPPLAFWQCDLLALMSIASVGLISGIRDGGIVEAQMFLAAQKARVHQQLQHKGMSMDEAECGVLFTSELSVASAMKGAFKITLNDVVGTAEKIHRALSMDKVEMRKLTTVMQDYSFLHTEESWCSNFLEAVVGSSSKDKSKRRSKPVNPAIIMKAYSEVQQRENYRRLIVTSWNGTLVPYNTNVMEAKPTGYIRYLLCLLATDPRNSIYIVAGDIRASLMNEWLGTLPIGLVAEHGLYLRVPPDAETASRCAKALLPSLEREVQMQRWSVKGKRGSGKVPGGMPMSNTAMEEKILQENGWKKAERSAWQLWTGEMTDFQPKSLSPDEIMYFQKDERQISDIETLEEVPVDKKASTGREGYKETSDKEMSLPPRKNVPSAWRERSQGSIGETTIGSDDHIAASLPPMRRRMISADFLPEMITVPTAAITSEGSYGGELIRSGIRGTDAEAESGIPSEERTVRWDDSVPADKSPESPKSSPTLSEITVMSAKTQVLNLLPGIDVSWFPEVYATMRYFCERTPGTRVVTGSASILFSWADALDASFGSFQARQLILHLRTFLSTSGTSRVAEVITAFHKRFVAVHPVGVNKGNFVSRLLDAPRYGRGIKYRSQNLHPSMLRSDTPGASLLPVSSTSEITARDRATPTRASATPLAPTALPNERTLSTEEHSSSLSDGTQIDKYTCTSYCKEPCSQNPNTPCVYKTDALPSTPVSPKPYEARTEGSTKDVLGEQSTSSVQKRISFSEPERIGGTTSEATNVPDNITGENSGKEALPKLPVPSEQPLSEDSRYSQGDSSASEHSIVPYFDFFLCLGDEKTDEGMLRIAAKATYANAMPNFDSLSEQDKPMGFGISIGILPGTSSQGYIPTVQGAVELLELLATRR